MAVVIFAAAVPAFRSTGESLPDMRPALCGSDPKSLVNLIDANALMKKGQGHGAVFFNCLVYPDSHTNYGVAYGGTPGTDALRQEVRQKLYDAHFIPAVYNHQQTYAWFYGTVTFSVVDGKPRLRVFASQEKSELTAGSDFIAPQSIYVSGHRYDPTVRAKNPFGSWVTEDVPGTVEFEITVDLTGHLKAIRLIQENPTGKGYGEHALKVLKEFTWIPAFRNGRAVETPTHLTFMFIPAGYQWKK